MTVSGFHTCLCRKCDGHCVRQNTQMMGVIRLYAKKPTSTYAPRIFIICTSTGHHVHRLTAETPWMSVRR